MTRSMTNKQRDRGRILTSEALAKLQHAIHDWEVKHEKRCTQERMKELTSRFKEGGLDPGTIGKILKGKGGVDPESIRCLFNAFGLVLEEADWVSSAPFILQVDPNFVGREGAIADLNTLINRGAKVIVIQARGGVGKTTLARKYLQQEFDSVLEFPIAKETKDIASIESLIEEKLRQLGEEPGREFLVSIDRLRRKLQTERIGILIDNLEPALDAAGKFAEPHRRYVELLRVLADPAVQSTTLITSRERLHEPSVTVQHYPLRSLDASAWEQFFQLRQLPISTPALAALHYAYGGNAKAMEIISSVIQTDYSSDVEAYWQENQDDLLIERDLEDLVTNQFDRLQEVDPDAYKLLCRMGCYRYQDVPTVPTEGILCLLWDISESRQKRVIRSLQERSLVELEGGDYWLHPVIRAEAIDRLRKSEDWKIANEKAAEFWTKKIKTIDCIEDALQSFEAYHHYLEINNYERAGSVIVEARLNKWEQKLTLGDSFYRLGSVQQMILGINRIIDTDSRFTGQLLHILANANWVDGNIRNAISYEEKSRIHLINSKTLVNEEVKFRIKLHSYLTTGIHLIYLWELSEAMDIFKKINEVAESEKFFGVYAKSLCYFAFISSITSSDHEVENSANEAYLALQRANLNPSSLTYHSQFLGLAYKNLGEIEKAFEIYNQIYQYLETSEYIQTKAKALVYAAELYRYQNDLRLAFSLHLDSIDLLTKIGAKCELGEAQYQLGLTYQAMGEGEKSIEKFQEAIRLFSEMEAPKQVERVRRSMEGRN